MINNVCQAVSFLGILLNSEQDNKLLFSSLDGRGFEGEWIRIYGMAKSLCCPPETITTLLIGYTSI